MDETDSSTNTQTEDESKELSQSLDLTSLAILQAEICRPAQSSNVES